MNRRDFLRRLTVGGVAAATAAREWPFRVFSFPQEIKIAPILYAPTPYPPIRIRFIRNFDPAQAKMVNRWDVLYGFMKLEENPRYLCDISGAKQIKICSPEDAEDLGLMTPHVRKIIQDASDKMERCASTNGAEDFETIATASPQRFIDCYELGLLKEPSDT